MNIKIPKNQDAHITCPANQKIVLNKISGTFNETCKEGDVSVMIVKNCSGQNSCVINTSTVGCNNDLNVEYSCVGAQANESKSIMAHLKMFWEENKKLIIVLLGLIVLMLVLKLCSSDDYEVIEYGEIRLPANLIDPIIVEPLYPPEILNSILDQPFNRSLA